MNITHQKDYADLLHSIKQRIRSAQYDALKAVNKELIGQKRKTATISCRNRMDAQYEE